MEAETSVLDDYVLSIWPPAPRAAHLPAADRGRRLRRADPSLPRSPSATALCEPSVSRCSASALEPIPLREHLLAQDVIYVGGGSMINLLALWRAHGLRVILREAWQAGIVLAGLSAGAMCWFEAGITKAHGPPAPGHRPRLPSRLQLGPLRRRARAPRRPTSKRSRRARCPAGYGVDDGVGPALPRHPPRGGRRRPRGPARLPRRRRRGQRPRARARAAGPRRPRAQAPGRGAPRHRRAAPAPRGTPPDGAGLGRARLPGEAAHRQHEAGDAHSPSTSSATTWWPAPSPLTIAPERPSIRCFSGSASAMSRSTPGASLVVVEDAGDEDHRQEDGVDVGGRGVEVRDRVRERDAERREADDADARRTRSARASPAASRGRRTAWPATIDDRDLQRPCW